MFLYPGSRLHRERQFANRVREAFEEHGIFVHDEAGRLVFQCDPPGPTLLVDRKVGSKFFEFCTVIVGVSPRASLVARTLDVIIAEEGGLQL